VPAEHSHAARFQFFPPIRGLHDNLARAGLEERSMKTPPGVPQIR
jgi:hypothetical protein